MLSQLTLDFGETDAEFEAIAIEAIPVELVSEAELLLPV